MSAFPCLLKPFEKGIKSYEIELIYFLELPNYAHHKKDTL